MQGPARIFLSYAHEAEREVEEIAVKLRARGYSVFFDKKSLRGEGFDEKIKAEVAGCDLFVFFASKESVAEGSYAITELGYAEARWSDPAGHVLVFRIGDVAVDRVPAYLRARMNVESVEGNFATGAFNRIDESLAPAPSEPVLSLVSPSLKDASVAEYAARLVDALSQRRHLPPTGKSTEEVARRIDGLVTSIRARFRPEEGSVVAGARLVKVIGVGNFGTVWEALELGTERSVAVKIFRLERLAEGQMLFRFRKSIRAMRILSEEKRLGRSPRARGTIVGFVQQDPTELAFSMELLTGGNLDDIGRRGWTLEHKLGAAVRVCTAVAYSHANGVIHRDIKPANIVLDAAGQAVLTDFDIADVKFATSMSTTVEGGLGTPVFAAPEQLADADHANERSDVYSLGRLIYYMLLERSPGYQVERDPTLDNLAGFPPGLVELVRSATQFDPSRRFASVVELSDALSRCRTGAAAWRARATRLRRSARQNWALLVIAGLVVAGSFGAAAYQTVVAARETEQRREQERLRAELEKLGTALLASIMQKDRALDRLGLIKARLAELGKQRPSAERDAEIRHEEERLALAEDALANVERQQHELRQKIEEAKRSPDSTEAAGVTTNGGRGATRTVAAGSTGSSSWSCPDLCAREGRCRLKNGVCVASSVEDCRRSAACTTRGACTLEGGECVSELKDPLAELKGMEAIPATPKPLSEGEASPSGP